jgi:hypothetical protein
MNIQTAKTLKVGNRVHHVERKNKDNTPMRARVTSIKTWKTRPDKIEVHLKHGLYEYAIFNENELDQIELD